MDQHKKTLGQVAYEQFVVAVKFDGVEGWDELDEIKQGYWQAIANVVASEVIYRIEEGLKRL